MHLFWLRKCLEMYVQEVGMIRSKHFNKDTRDVLTK